MEVKEIAHKLNGADPVYNRPIANINTELKNPTRSLLECFAIDACYKIIFKTKTDFSQGVLAATAAFEPTADIEMFYAKSSPSKTTKPNSYNKGSWRKPPPAGRRSGTPSSS